MSVLLAVLVTAIIAAVLAWLGWLLAQVALDVAPLTPEERERIEREWHRNGGADGGLL